MEKRVISTQIQEEDLQTETSLRPMSLEEYNRTGKNKRHPACLYRGGTAEAGTVRSCVVLRTAWTWKDNTFRYHCQ